jgi:hypothetical protein
MSRVFNILGTRHRGKHIEVTMYVVTANGVKIKITHNVPAAAGKTLRWVQTVSDNSSFTKECGLTPHVDPFADPSKSGNPSMHKFTLPSIGGVCKADDLEPFYYTSTEEAAGSGQPVFSDSPGIDAPPKGRTWTNFVTALTEVTAASKSVFHLVAITWGYDRLSDGSVKENGIHVATPAEMWKHGAALKKMYPDWHYT